MLWPCWPQEAAAARCPPDNYHCAFAEDGRRLSRFFARANSYTFIEFLKQITAKLGKVAVAADQYSAHFYVVKEFIRKNRKDLPKRDIQMVRFPAS